MYIIMHIFTGSNEYLAYDGKNKFFFLSEIT